MDINSITLTGRLVRAPELRTVAESDLATIRLAFDQRGKDAPGFIDVEVWGAYAQTVRPLRKGQRVGVTGQLRYREWSTDAGERRSAFAVRADQVVFLDPREERTPEPQEAAAA